MHVLTPQNRAHKAPGDRHTQAVGNLLDGRSLLLQVHHVRFGKYTASTRDYGPLLRVLGQRGQRLHGNAQP